MNPPQTRVIRYWLLVAPLFVLLDAGSSEAQVHVGARAVEWSLAGGVVLSLEQVPFSAAKHRITRKRGVVVRIDGKEFWGKDGDLPRCELKSARARIGDRSFELPVDGLFEPLLPAQEETRSRCGSRTGPDGTRIRCDFSDMAGAYRVVWRITPEGAVLRFVELIA